MDKALITKIELHKLSVPLKEPFIISLGPIYSADNVVVVVHTEAGIAGWENVARL
ncbi:hypothetical protein KRR40_19180 [Niabella defluvii]|nr:hypothetical protein KRR40_19180 [Niabella sp. I65]